MTYQLISLDSNARYVKSYLEKIEDTTIDRPLAVLREYAQDVNTTFALLSDRGWEAIASEGVISLR